VGDLALPGVTGPAPRHVQLWGGDLDTMPMPEPGAWLSADERARAARYRFERDRRGFERRRAWLRQLLGGYLGLHPGRVRLQYGAHGKPAVADHPWLHFSLSHAGGRVLCALAAGRRIGVDLVRGRPEPRDDAVARALFAPGEIAGLQALPPAARGPAFHRCWTRKEAYVKALGEGLARPLHTFEVSLAPATWTTLVGCGFDRREPARWAFLLLEPFAGYVASVAIESGAEARAA
jgi:4'-phosphopantetheinyl transferase